MNNYPAIIAKLTEDARCALADNSAAGYNRLTAVLSQLDRLVQADVQELSDVSLLAVIRKLKAGDPLTDEDKNNIRWWMVAEPRLQIQSKEDLDQLRAHFDRLMPRLTQSAGQTMDVAALLTLQGLFREAGRLAAELSQNAQQSERLGNFEITINRLREEEREFLIRLLEQKIKGG